MSNTKSAFITILGRPNVGKSSLLNKILGQKVSIVSDKPQTTRTRIMGVYTKDETQLVFIDTPGFHKPRNALGEKMIKAVGEGMSDVDATILVVEASTKFHLEEGELPAAERALIEQIKARKLNTVLVINKIDTLNDKETLLSLIKAYMDEYDFACVVPLSAKTGDGCDILLNELCAFAKESAHFFDSETITDQPDRVMVSEIIREKALYSLDKEIPHGIAVGIDRFFERDDANGEPIIEIYATIYCERDSHKGIIIGKNGAMLKKIGINSRFELEKFFGTKILLQLWVKVKKDWRNSEALIHNFGLD